MRAACSRRQSCILIKTLPLPKYCCRARKGSGVRTNPARERDLQRMLRKWCWCLVCCIASSEHWVCPRVILIKAAAWTTVSRLKREAEGFTDRCERSHGSCARVAYSLGLQKIISSGNYILITYIPLQFQLDVVWFCIACPKLLSVCCAVEKFSFHSSDALNYSCVKLWNLPQSKASSRKESVMWTFHCVYFVFLWPFQMALIVH